MGWLVWLVSFSLFSGEGHSWVLSHEVVPDGRSAYGPPIEWDSSVWRFPGGSSRSPGVLSGLYLSWMAPT